MPHIRPIVRLTTTLALFACGSCGTMTGTRYAPLISNTLALREAQLAKVNVGEITTAPGARHDVEKISTRAVTLKSAYGSYRAYLREALATELDHADLLDSAAPVRIDGVLLRNEFGGEAGRERVIVEAELTVTRNGVEIYRGRKTGAFDWHAAFPPAVSVPRAQSNYQAGVQRLIGAFIADPAFVAALRPR